MNIGTFITQLRESAGLTQANLAELRGITRTAQVRAEADDSNPAISTLVNIVERLGCSLELVAVNNDSGKRESLMLVAPSEEFWDHFIARPESPARRMAQVVCPGDPLDGLLLRDLIVSVADSYRDARTRIHHQDRYLHWTGNEEPIYLPREERLRADLKEIRDRLVWIAKTSGQSAVIPEVIGSDDLLFGFNSDTPIEDGIGWRCSRGLLALIADHDRVAAVVERFAAAVDATPELLLGDFR